MKTYLAGQSVTATIPLLDEDGLPVLASAVTYNVLNHVGVSIASGTLSPWTGTETEAQVMIAAEDNALSGDNVREIRIVELTLTTADGTKVIAHDYMVEKIDPLVVPSTSFQTYNEALALAYSVPSIDAWNSATKQARIAALIQARHNIARFRYEYDFFDEMSYSEPAFYIDSINDMTYGDFMILPEAFLAALRRAQLIEANWLLTNDSVARMREEGLMSKTVGESSIMLRPGKPIRRFACEDAYREISKYISTKIGVARG